MNNYLKSFNQNFSTNKIYSYFHLKGLANLGSTCPFNSILQCLLHIDEFISYFLNKFPKDIGLLKEKNKNVKTNGNISQTLYKLIKELYEEKDDKEYKEYHMNNLFYSHQKWIEPREILKIIGKYNEYLYHGPYHWDKKDPKKYFVFILESIHNELKLFRE
jgi:ubiquitin C-terminal hydrolase